LANEQKDLAQKTLANEQTNNAQRQGELAACWSGPATAARRRPAREALARYEEAGVIREALAAGGAGAMQAPARAGQRAHKLGDPAGEDKRNVEALAVYRRRWRCAGAGRGRA